MDALLGYTQLAKIKLSPEGLSISLSEIDSKKITPKGHDLYQAPNTLFQVLLEGSIEVSPEMLKYLA